MTHSPTKLKLKKGWHRASYMSLVTHSVIPAKEKQEASFGDLIIWDSEKYGPLPELKEYEDLVKGINEHFRSTESLVAQFSQLRYALLAPRCYI